MAASRISVEVLGTSSSLQAAVAKAAESLKGLGAELTKQTNVALGEGERTVKMNDLVARSYQRTALAATSTSKEASVAYTRSASSQVAASDKVIAASDRQAAAVR